MSDSTEIQEGELTLLEGHGSNQEAVATILTQLKQDMTAQEWDEFAIEVKRAVVEQTLRELKANQDMMEFGGGNDIFEPQDFLNMKNIVEGIRQEVKFCWEHDQTGKTHEVMQVIFDEAEERGIVETKRQGGEKE